jgi:predicted nucleic acid-binding protein
MAFKIGLDTSFVIGLLDDKDVWHRSAKDLYESILTAGYRPFIFDCVLAEVISTLARRTHEKHRTADFYLLLSQIKTQFPAKAITWLYPDLPKRYDAVVELVEKSSGELNFNDALIAISCQNRNIYWLASFDSDFDTISWLKRAAHASDLPTE